MLTELLFTKQYQRKTQLLNGINMRNKYITKYAIVTANVTNISTCFIQSIQINKVEVCVCKIKLTPSQ